MKFGVGQPIRRVEDQNLITGQGRYTDDIHLEKAATAVVLRARVAHANIRKLDATAASCACSSVSAITSATGWPR